jgi:hypothetical protein
MGLKGFQQVRRDALNRSILPTKEFTKPCQRSALAAVVGWLRKLCGASKQPASLPFSKVLMNKLLATLAASLFLVAAHAQTAAPAAPAVAPAPVAAAAPEAAAAPQATAAAPKASKTHKAAKSSHKKVAKKKAHKTRKAV